MSAADRPRPLAEPHTAPYWEAARRHELHLQRCDECARWIHPPRHACPACGFEAPGFQPACGRGTIYGFTVSHVSGGPGFDAVPYAIAVVELEEQERLLTVGNVLGADISELAVGRAVTVAFEDLDDGTTLPQWELTR